METQQIAHVIPFMLPIHVALICILLLFRLQRRGESQLKCKSIMFAIIAFASTALGWAAIVLYFIAPTVYVLLGAPIMWLFMCVNILYYRFVYEITKTDSDERFSLWHFFAPTLIALVYLIWSLFVPFDIQVFLVELKGKIVDGYAAYSWFSPSKLLFFSISMAFYGLIIIRRVKRFQRIVGNYSADEQRISLSWLSQIVYPLLGASLLISGFSVFFNQMFASSPIVILPILFFIFKDVMFTHNILLDNFVIIVPESVDELQAQVDEQIDDPLLPDQTQHEIDRLELYMHKTKPYLKPKLKITDIMIDLNTNRTSLSLLINRTYGMNFSRFVNRYRLSELERLKAEPNNATLSELDLVMKVGFSDWRGYLRVKQREEDSAI